MADNHPTSLPELKKRITQERQRLLDLVDNLSPAERDEIRDPAGWSAKDHVAHLTPWERSMVYLLRGQPRHEGLGIDEDVYLGHDMDRMNDVIFRQHRDLDWDTVRAEFDAVHEDMFQALDEVGWDGLWKHYSDYLPDEPGEDRGQPVAYYVAGNTYGHYDMHRGWIEELLRGTG